MSRNKEKKPFYKRIWFIGLVVFIIIGAIFDGVDDEDSTKPSAHSQEATSEEQTDTQEVQEPVEALTLNGRIENGIIELLGSKTNTENDRIVEIKVNNHLGVDIEGAKITLITLVADENLTTSMTRKGMLMNSAKLFEILYSEDEIEEAVLFWQFPLVDTYGNEEIGNVMKVVINTETADKINWENFDYNNIPQIANDYWEHQGFSE